MSKTTTANDIAIKALQSRIRLLEKRREALNVEINECHIAISKLQDDAQ